MNSTEHINRQQSHYKGSSRARGATNRGAQGGVDKTRKRKTGDRGAPVQVRQQREVKIESRQRCLLLVITRRLHGLDLLFDSGGVSVLVRELLEFVHDRNILEAELGELQLGVLKLEAAIHPGDTGSDTTTKGSDGSAHHRTTCMRQ